jgi:hypothetical protein
VAYEVLLLGLLGARDLLRREWPPLCHSGRCQGSFRHKPGDYEVVVVQDVADRRFHVLHRCRCGHYYEQIGQRFMERRPDGSTHPYMVLKPYRGWFPDDAREDTPPSDT